MTQLRISAVICLAAAVGCGGTQEPPLVPAKGTVSWKAKPLAGAVVSFIPVADTKGAGGSTVTGADGGFDVKYVRGGSGLPEGEYKVVISKRLTPDGSPPPPDVGEMDSNAKETIPERYSSPEKTTLQANIKSGAPPLKFELK